MRWGSRSRNGRTQPLGSRLRDLVPRAGKKEADEGIRDDSMLEQQCIASLGSLVINLEQNV